MILILAQKQELNVNNVCRILDHYGAQWIRLNGEDFPLRTRLHLECSGAYQSGEIIAENGKAAPYSQIRAVWNRRHGEAELGEHLTRGQKLFIQKECGYTLLGIYSLLSH